MPIYEYECHDCRRVVSLLVLRPGRGQARAGPRWGGSALTRVMSRFATVKSEEARLEALGDSAALGDIDENAPASVARFMKKMGREMGEDLGDDFEDTVDEALAESGEGDVPGDDAGTPSDSGLSSTADL